MFQLVLAAEATYYQVFERGSLCGNLVHMGTFPISVLIIISPP